MAEGKFVVRAKNEVKEGLDSAKRDLLGFQDAAEAVGNKLKSALTVTAIASGLVKLGKAAFECFQEFGEADRRIQQLNIALGGNQSSLKKATDLIDDMRKMSLASKDDIEGLVAELASLGKSDAEIDKITRASVNLSNITGKDLNTSFTQINATYSGTAGKLEKLIPGIGDLTKEQLAAGGATDLINGKFTELSSSLATNNIPQKIKNLSDGFSDFKESVGEMTATFFTPVIEGIQSIIDHWNDAYTAQKNTMLLSSQSGYVAKIQAANENKKIFSGELSTINAKKAEYEKKNLTNDPVYLDLKRQAMVYQNKIDTLDASITDWKKLIAKSPATFDETFNLPTYLLGNQGTEDGGSGGKPKKTTESRAFSASDLARAYRPPVESSPFQGAFSASDMARAYRNPADAYVFDPSAMEFGDVSATFADDLSVALEPVIDAVTGGLAYRGQSSLVPETLGAGGASIYDQVWAPILEALQSEFATPQQRLAPEGYAPRDDFLDQIWGPILADLQNEFTTPQQRLAPDGMEARDDFMDQVWGPILAALQAEFTTPAQRQAPEGYAARDDFKQQLGMTGEDLRAGARGFILSGNASVVGQEAANLTWLDKAGNKIADFFDDAKKKIEPVFDKIGKNVIQPVVNKVESSPLLSGIIASVGPVFAKIGAVVGPLIDKFGGMLSSVSSIAQILDPVTTIFKALFTVIEPVLNKLLTPLVGILNVIGSALGDILVPILEALSPVIEALATAFVWLYNNVIVPVGNLIYSMMATVWNGIAAAINFLLGWLGVSLAYMDTQLKVLDAISLEDVKASGETSVTDSTSTTSASYASQSITVNIYQQGILIGDDGMATLARTVRDQIDYLAYTGR